MRIDAKVIRQSIRRKNVGRVIRADSRERLARYDFLAKGDEVAVGGQHQQFSLPIRLVRWAMDIGLGKGVELRFQLSVQRIHVPNIDVVGEPAIAGRCTFRTFLFADAEAGGFAMNICVIGHAPESFKAKNIVEEGQCLFEIFDMHEGRDLNEIGHGYSPCTICVASHSPAADWIAVSSPRPVSQCTSASRRNQVSWRLAYCRVPCWMAARASAKVTSPRRWLRNSR